MDPETRPEQQATGEPRRSVKVSWVLGSTRQSLVWIILVTAILGWLLGIATSVILRYRTRRRD
jgi:hypothetical protein